jgi:hypothetical protein
MRITRETVVAIIARIKGIPARKVSNGTFLGDKGVEILRAVGDETGVRVWVSTPSQLTVGELLDFLRE